MERLTQWIEKDRALPRMDLKNNGYEKCTNRLAAYEDTGLTPEEAQRLSELRGQGQFIDIEDIPFLWKEYVEADPDTLTEGAKRLADKLRKAIAKLMEAEECIDPYETSIDPKGAGYE